MQWFCLHACPVYQAEGKNQIFFPLGNQHSAWLYPQRYITHSSWVMNGQFGWMHLTQHPVITWEFINF